jgi:excisionase family DNA binding protein
MFTENEPVYFFTRPQLTEILQEVVRKEITGLENRLVKKGRTLTREESAVKLGVSPNTISRFINDGRLTNVGIGRKILINESELDGFTKFKNVKSWEYLSM